MSFEEISKITFDQAAIDWFAEQSGDWNPIHVDPIAARRFMAGGVIAHGMLTLLWALENYCVQSGSVPAKFAVSFHRPVLSGEMIHLRVERMSNNSVRLQVYNKEEVVATIRIEGVCSSRNSAMPESAVCARSTPRHLQFADLKGLTGALSLQAVESEVKRHFPSLVEAVGLLPVSAIMAASRIVGMHCPGLSSLYSGAEFEFRPEDESPALGWKVVRHTLAQAPVRIQVDGGGITGRLDAFVRPDPVVQPTIEQIASHIERDLCQKQVAWVIGGGRGLGELVSKMVAAGSGRVVLTYHKGLEDAQRVAAEITSWGGRCEVFELDVHNPTSVSTMIRKVGAPTHLYYFASSRISRPRHSFFEEALLGEFIDIYVNSFARMIAAARQTVSGPLKVFYPSTIFIDEMPREFPEYMAAKSAGEAVCRYLSLHLPDLDVVVKRLPRLPTDQTSGLIKISTSDPVAELLAVVREMSIPHHMDVKNG